MPKYDTAKLAKIVAIEIVAQHFFFVLFFHSIFTFILQKGNLLNEVPLNSTYWAPVDAHDPIRVQQIMLGLSKIPAEKMDLALARDTKICECQ